MTSLLVIFILSLVLAGCNNPAGDRTDKYGTLLYESPDSLLIMVTCTDTSGMTTYERHLYDLMYTAAMYRTGVFSEDTAVISAAERYFLDIDDKEHAAMAKVVHAENAYNQFDYYKALRKLMEAEILAGYTDNDALKHDVFNQLYVVNSETGCGKRASEACNKAAEYAVNARLVSQMVTAYNNMAMTLIENDRLDEAARVIGECAAIAENADKRQRSGYYRVRGRYLIEKDSMNAALGMFKKAERILPTAEIFYDMAEVYLNTGRTDSCLNYCHFAITADRRGYVSMKAYDIIVKNFSNQLGINTLIRICNDLNGIYLKRAEAADVIKIEAIQAAYDEKDGGVSVWWFVVGVTLMITSVVWIAWRRPGTISDENGDMVLMNESIVYDLHRLSAQGRTPSQEQWIALHSAANKHICFFLEHLHKINDLSARDINICLLTRLHFSPSEIAVLTDMSPQSVTNTRSRLLGKIFGIKGGAAEFDRRIAALR